MTQFQFTREEVEQAFKQLEGALRFSPLPNGQGGSRYVAANEFMLMHRNVIAYGFKHRNTRNYVYLVNGNRLLYGGNGVEIKPFNYPEF